MRRILWLIGALLFTGATETSARVTPEVRGQVSAAATGLPLGGARITTVLTKWQARTDHDGYFSLLLPDSGRFDLYVFYPTLQPVRIVGLVACEGSLDSLQITLRDLNRELGIVIEIRADPALLPPFGLGSNVPTVNESTVKAFGRMKDSLLVEDLRLRLSENGEVFIRGGRAGDVSCMYHFRLPLPLDFLASSPFDVDQASPPGTDVPNATKFRRTDARPYDDEFAPIAPSEFSLDFTTSKALHSKH